MSSLDIVEVGNSQPKTIPVSITSTNKDGESHTFTVNAIPQKLADDFDVRVISTANGKVIRYIETSSDLTTGSASNKVIGKANFDFAKRKLTIELKNGETKFYKLVEINRRPVNKIAPGKIVSEIAKEKAPFPLWKRLFPGDRISEPTIVVEEPEAKEKPTVLDRETRRFSLLEWFKRIFSPRANTAKLTN